MTNRYHNFCLFYLSYCIAAIKIRAKSFSDFISSIDTCDIDKYQKKFLPNKKYDCIMSSQDER